MNTFKIPFSFAFCEDEDETNKYFVVNCGSEDGVYQLASFLNSDSFQSTIDHIEEHYGVMDVSAFQPFVGYASSEVPDDDIPTVIGLITSAIVGLGFTIEHDETHVVNIESDEAFEQDLGEEYLTRHSDIDYNMATKYFWTF